VKQARSVLTQSFDEAAEFDVLEINVLRGMKLSLKKTAKRVPPEIPDLLRLLAAAKSSRYQHLDVVVLLAVTCGMRLAEALGLRWSNIDFDAAKLYVRETVDRDGSMKAPKSEAGLRQINVDEDVVLALRAHQARQREWARLCGSGYDSRADLVNPRPNGKPWHVSRVSRHFASLAKSLCIAGTYHDLRHAHASDLLKNNVDPRTVANRLGHSDPKMTMSIYAHTGSDSDRKAANVMRALLREAAVPRNEALAGNEATS